VDGSHTPTTKAMAASPTTYPSSRWACSRRVSKACHQSFTGVISDHEPAVVNPPGTAMPALWLVTAPPSAIMAKVESTSSEARANSQRR